jgi:hypothetical protein
MGAEQQPGMAFVDGLSSQLLLVCLQRFFIYELLLAAPLQESVNCQANLLSEFTSLIIFDTALQRHFADTFNFRLCLLRLFHPFKSWSVTVYDVKAMPGFIHPEVEVRRVTSQLVRRQSE